MMIFPLLWSQQTILQTVFEEFPNESCNQNFNYGEFAIIVGANSFATFFQR